MNTSAPKPSANPEEAGVSFRNSLRLRRGARWVIGLLGAYGLVIVILVACEERLAFPGWTFPQPWVALPAGTVVEKQTVDTADGNAIQTWWLPSPGWTPGHGALIYLHGNGENISTCGKDLVKWRRELHTGVLTLDYPGFGHSTGTPDEQSCYAAAQAAFDGLVLEKKVAAQDIVVVGQSMGGAIATELASRRRCRMLLTSSAFTSFPEVAQYRFFWMPARHLVSLQFDNLGKMGRLETPVFITHGTDDRRVPFSHGERLYEAAAATTPRRFYLVPGHGHSQPTTAEFYEAVRQFLKETKLANPGV